jgi:hypothetical protein
MGFMKSPVISGLVLTLQSHAQSRSLRTSAGKPLHPAQTLAMRNLEEMTRLRKLLLRKPDSRRQMV